MVDANKPRFQVGIKLGKRPQLGRQILLGIADLLPGLEQADESAERAGSTTGKAGTARATTACLETVALTAKEHPADVAKATHPSPGKACKASPPKESAPTLKPRRW